MGRAWMGPGILAMAILLAAGPAGAAQAARSTTARPPDAGDDAGAEAHFELGEMYHRQVFEALDNAIKEYEAALHLQPDFPDAHYYLGLAYHSKAKLGNDDKPLYTKALQQYRLYLRQKPHGELAAKAKQNAAAVEAVLGGQRAPAAAKRTRRSGGKR